jgi:hypothetical protein
MWMSSIVFAAAGSNSAVPDSLKSDEAGFLKFHVEKNRYSIIIDSNQVFNSSIDSLSLSVGSHRVVIEEGTKWNAVVLDTIIDVKKGAVCALTIPALFQYTILSVPSHALIEAGDSVIGTTPSTISTVTPVETPLRLELQGYSQVEIQPPFTSLTIINLHPLEFEKGIEGSAENGNFKKESRLIYGSLATSILAGGVSAWAKNKANAFDDAYQIGQNPADRSSRNTYDILAGASLVVSELGFATLTYLLLEQ